MGEKEWSAETVFDLFGDPVVRRVLVLASRKPMSADELADCLDASRPTLYRRLNALADYDLVSESVEVSEDGNHYRTYETTLKRVTFELDGGGYNVDIESRHSLVDQFEAFWEDLDQSTPDVEADGSDRADRTRSPGRGYDG